jgi:hypothetical protein
MQKVAHIHLSVAGTFRQHQQAECRVYGHREECSHKAEGRQGRGMAVLGPAKGSRSAGGQQPNPGTKPLQPAPETGQKARFLGGRRLPAIVVFFPAAAATARICGTGLVADGRGGCQEFGAGWATAPGDFLGTFL